MAQKAILFFWNKSQLQSNKVVIQFNFIRYLLRLRRVKRKSVKIGVFWRGWVTFGEYFRGKGASTTNRCWCEKTRVISLLYGIKISAVHYLVLLQYTRLTDGQTDKQTDRIGTSMPCVGLRAYMESHDKKLWLRTVGHLHRTMQFVYVTGTLMCFNNDFDQWLMEPDHC